MSAALDLSRLVRIADHASDDRAAIECHLGMRSFRAFFRMAWPHIDPAHLLWSWHIDLLCEEMERVARRETTEAVFCVPPRSGKPVQDDELVLVRGRGRVPLREVRVGDEVLTHRGRFRRVTAVHIQGVLPTVTIRTFTDRVLRCAPDHPVLTPYGWREAGSLRSGDTVAVVEPGEDAGSATLTAEEAWLLGVLIGDGALTQRHVFLTSGDEAVLAAFESAVRSMGWRPSRIKAPPTKAGRITICHGQGPPGRRKAENPIHAWLRAHGLFGANSYTKRVPPAVLAGDRAVIAAFLDGYFSADGNITARGRTRSGGERRDRAVDATTVSEGLARDLQHLLLRIGVNARVRRRERAQKTQRQGDRYVWWNVELGDSNEVARFADRVALRHARGRKMEHLRGGRSDFDRVLVPDRVVAVAAADPAPCRCLTVEEDESFTASDIAVHNSQLMSVAFPAWVWTWFPAAKFITGSNEMTLATRDAVTMRRLVKSDWYQRRWGPGSRFLRGVKLSTGEAHPGVAITDDQDNKTLYQTTAGGHRFCCTPGSNVTGHGGDFVLCLPGDQTIVTDLGPQPIETVVAERRARLVLAYDHEAGRAEFHPILDFEVHPARELVEIETDDGHVLRCTIDHPVWVEGRGYVRADEVQPNDVVLTCPAASIG